VGSLISTAVMGMSSLALGWKTYTLRATLMTSSAFSSISGAGI
jgi:hypothetical protein